MILATMQQANDVLSGRKDQKELSNRVRLADPYLDKRFAPVIAGWVVKLGITPEEHSEDVVLFKQLQRRLKGLRVPANNRDRTGLVKALLAKKPHDFTEHYSALQAWNRQASDILDPNRSLSDEGLPVEMRYRGYTMYRIETEEHCRIPLVANTMSWCVTKGSFGKYGGPPYYPIVRDRDRKPFAMIVPNYFDKNPDQAVRNVKNDGPLSPRDLKLVRPLVQHAVPFDKYKHPRINGLHGVPPPHTSPFLDVARMNIKNYGFLPGEWPEAEAVIAREHGTSTTIGNDRYIQQTTRKAIP